MTEKEKNNAELLVEQFLMQHQFFSKTWLTLSQSQKTELIKIIVSWKKLKKLIQSTLCKNDPKTEIFFQRKNSLACLRTVC